MKRSQKHLPPVAVVIEAIAEELIRPAGATAFGRGQRLIRLLVAVVVDAVTGSLGDLPTGAARIEHVFVGDSIAVVVEAITDLLGHLAALATRVLYALVDVAIAVVVLAVAHLNLGFTAQIDPEVASIADAPAA